MDTAWRVRFGRTKARLPWGGLLACLLAVAQPITAGDLATSAPRAVRFGILPVSGAVESRQQWEPLLEDLEKRLGRPVSAVSVSTYAGLSGAIAEQRVDIAFLSGRLATEAVQHQHMSVIAQCERSDGVKGNVAVLVTRSDGPIHSLKDLFARPGHWRYARGETLSVTGYIAPEAELFAPRGLNSDTFFASVRVGNHQNNALAVANGEVDVASNNGPDLELFRRNFPSEAAQVRVIWSSSLIPTDVLVARDDLPEPLRSQLIAFMRGYGHAPGAAGERERANLARIQDLAGFAAADNRVLQPILDLQFQLVREQAEHGRWVNDQAKATRLQQIDADYRRAMAQLSRH
ncbi:phosphate/phosphite/phosphonate ABC transporter substrate-binding protein [Dyella sp. C9]|uniref:phosphate/phosphite/phosphonate ABC transporter substrate-binding protein n=1 Tax=Dyella sp. C9 TaxID=2202154 RepID=UPI000DEFDC9C|nr:phosphate/phosphite/phosphonate ABC transporter substrate-binding protein [Dyella sp. C9]